MEQRISIITLGVASVPASRAFYERLGWKASGAGGDAIAFFQTGGSILALYGRADLIKDVRVSPEPIGNGSVSLAVNVRRREEVDAVLAEAVRAGARLLKPAQETFWGGYHGYFADPDGHPWEIAWNPSFAIREDGSIVLPA
jgi:uncharacterized glyoxalase superfamily protein PhnB